MSRTIHRGSGDEEAAGPLAAMSPGTEPKAGGIRDQHM